MIPLPNFVDVQNYLRWPDFSHSLGGVQWHKPNFYIERLASFDS